MAYQKPHVSHILCGKVFRPSFYRYSKVEGVLLFLPLFKYRNEKVELQSDCPFRPECEGHFASWHSAPASSGELNEHAGVPCGLATLRPLRAPHRRRPLLLSLRVLFTPLRCSIASWSPRSGRKKEATSISTTTWSVAAGASRREAARRHEEERVEDAVPRAAAGHVGRVPPHHGALLRLLHARLPGDDGRHRVRRLRCSLRGHHGLGRRLHGY
jgi:hypothetical protein